MKVKVLLLFCLTLNIKVNAKNPKERKVERNTTISVFANFNSGKCYFKESSNGLSTDGHATNFGLGICRDYYLLPDDMYLSFGLRYYATSSKLRSGTDIPGADRGASCQEYSLTYAHYAVPLYLGKRILFSKKNNAHINIFGGFSFGVSGITNVAYNSMLVTSEGNTDEISCSGQYTNDRSYKFNASFDIGFRVAPLKRSNFSIGFTGSFELSHPNNFIASGSFINTTRALSSNYKTNYSQSFTNAMLQVNYTFGKSINNACRQVQCF